MRQLILVGLLLLGTQALGNEIQFSHSPERPIIIHSNLEYPNQQAKSITGPWFKAYYIIGNMLNQPVTVTGFHFRVTSSLGVKTETDVTLDEPHEIEKGAIARFTEIYVGGLAKSELPHLGENEYYVEVSAQGWIGPIDNPGEKLTLSDSFKTQ